MQTFSVVLIVQKVKSLKASGVSGKESQKLYLSLVFISIFLLFMNI